MAEKHSPAVGQITVWLKATRLPVRQTTLRLNTSTTGLPIVQKVFWLNVAHLPIGQIALWLNATRLP